MNSKEKLVIFIAVFVCIILPLIFSSFYTIGAGKRGVILNWGAVQDKVADEGLHFKVPIMQKIVKMDVRVQKEEVQAGAASKDLQTVNAVIAINYHLSPDRVNTIYQDIGREYKERIIAPSIQEAVKAGMAKFTAEELITKREIVKDVIRTELRERLSGSNIIVDEFNIVNFEFSKGFDKAIEFKVTAEQEALAAKNQLERVKFEAQQQIEAAIGKADAMRREAQALRESPELLELRALEKWDGVLPVYMLGQGAVPFINIPND